VASTTPAKTTISSSNPPPLSSEQQGVSRQWKDLLVRAGIRIEFAWRFAISLARAGYDETNAESLTDKELKSIGMSMDDAKATLRTIREVADEYRAEMAAKTEDTTPSEEDDATIKKHAFNAWRSLLIRARLGKEWGAAVTARYAALLAKQGGTKQTLMLSRRKILNKPAFPMPHIVK